MYNIKKQKKPCPNCGKMIIPRNEYQCTRCGSGHTVAHGDNVSVKQGMRKRRKCQDCGHTFYADVKIGGYV